MAKINAIRKGKTGERNLCKIFTDRFNQPFNRTVGSGARIYQVNLQENLKSIFSGDITTPDNFLFSIESKAGYDIDFSSIFEKGNSDIDKFLEQAEHDANYCNKLPMLIYKKDRRPYLVFIKKYTLNDYINKFNYYLSYRDWHAVSLNELLKLEDNFFFKQQESL